MDDLCKLQNDCMCAGDKVNPAAKNQGGPLAKIINPARACKLTDPYSASSD